VAFADLKTAVTTVPVLVSPQESDPFQIEVDSSDFATGAVLSQQSMTDGKWHPVVFYSKSLSSMEQNYEIHNKKILAIIRVLKEWRHFLEGATHLVEIWTDHKNLEYFMMAKKLNCYQAHWSLHLARFDFLLHHHPRRTVTNFIRPYLHQFFIDSHGLNGYGKPLKRPFDWYQSRLEAINNGRDIRQINW